MPLCIEVTLDYMSIAPEVIWELLRTSHPLLLPDSKHIEFYGDLLTVANMHRAIKKKGKPHFLATFAESELCYGPVGNQELSQIFIKNCVEGNEDAWTWVKPLSQIKEFRASRIYDKEYEFWQNAEDPIQYRGSGRSYEGLPMKSNEAPPPLNQMIIDTSQNPGRRVFREGYVEAIGSVMWLGDQYWKLTGAKKQDVLAADWLKCEELPNNVFRVQAFEQPFTTAEGEQGQLQNRLRTLLFPKTGK